MSQIGSGSPNTKNDFIETLDGFFPVSNIISANGHTTVTSNSVFKLCARDNLDAALPKPYLTSAQTVTVSSTSSSDSSTGVGVRLLNVVGLDANYLPTNQVVPMDGQNPVSTTVEFLRITDIVALSFGTNVTAEGDKVGVGTIYCGYGAVVGGVPANVLIAMVPPDIASHTSIFTIFGGYTGFIRQINFSVNPSVIDVSCQFLLAARFTFSEGWYKTTDYYITNSFSLFNIPAVLPEKTDLELRVKNNNNQPQQAHVDIVVELKKNIV